MGYIHTYLRPSVHRRDLYGTLLDDCCCASWLISICPPRFEIDFFSVHHHRTFASIVSAPRCRRPSFRWHPCLHVSLTRQPDQLILILRVAGRGFLVCVPFQRGPLFSVLLLADCTPPFGATSWTTSTHCFLVTVEPVVLIVAFNLRHLLGTPSSPKDPSYPHLDHSPPRRPRPRVHALGNCRISIRGHRSSAGEAKRF